MDLGEKIFAFFFLYQ